MATLPDDLIREILVRLPHNHLLRCRAVCKAWRDDRLLIRDHHSRQPRQPLLFSSGVGPFSPNDRLEAFNLSTDERRMVLVRRPSSDNFVAHYRIDGLVIHGSCDGLLLLGFRESFLVCNPATRQGARLGLLYRDRRDIVGFYKHADSGEYRVLYHQVEDLELEGLEGKHCYYVLTLGSQQAARDITPSAAVGAQLARRLARGLESSSTSPPVLLRGSLHWSPQQSQDFNILVFDPAAESFRWIPPPANAMLGTDNHTHTHTQLFEMTEGTLAMFCWHHSANKSVIWFMEVYDKVKWVKCPVELLVNPAYAPFRLLPYPPVLYQGGDMLVLDNPCTVSHYDKMGKLQGSVNCFARRLTITPHVLKESLVLHEFLQKRRNDGAGDEWYPELEFADGSDTAISGDETQN